ncbi:lysylphosphatidylglycerol synthase transmembrane domain-containing protein [Planotetraspora kaengkrachanensis]|uniref:Membrane protein n=1 Tax=Planotetraspora kaengkrachanensis TaxID=575193 RepID=A0A8J3LY36_9ACTN|nr:YbhN family protein [Planotetraspora kaengkrachanensis]GIG78538.1 membrane protein [Planotetraspora kaengkrachanensis]
MPRWVRWALGGVAAGLVVSVVRSGLPDPDEVWHAMGGLNVGWLSVAVLAQILSMGTFARLIRRLLILGGAHLTVPRAVALTYARNAVTNSFPAGQVVGIAYTTRQFARLGAAKPLIAATLVLSGVYSTATFVMLGAVAVLGEPSIRPAGVTVLALVLVLVGALSLVRPRAFGEWLGRRFPRAMDQMRAARRAVTMARRDRLMLAWLALANWLLDVACLAAVCEAAGVHIGPHTVLLGYVAAKAAAVLLLIPGGLGIAEIGLAATLIGGGVAGGTAAAVVLLYRLISYWGVLVAGWAAWLLLLDGLRPRLRAGGHWFWDAFVRWAVALSPCTPYPYRDLPR